MHFFTVSLAPGFLLEANVFGDLSAACLRHRIGILLQAWSGKPRVDTLVWLTFTIHTCPVEEIWAFSGIPGVQ